MVLTRIATNSGLSHLRRLRAQLAARRLRSYEVRVCRQFQAVVTVSEHDRRILAYHSRRDHIVAVPNGVDAQYFRPLSKIPSNQAEILFAGSLFWWPNVDAVQHFCTAIFPLIRQDCADTRLSIVGQGAPPSIEWLGALPGVTMVGRVEDLRPYYARAAICVVPLRSGSGTRLRILEAMAMAKPVVSTTIGSEGLAAKDGVHLLTADTPEDFARQVVALLRNPSLRRTLGRSARALVEDQYQWSNIVPKLEEVYMRVGQGEHS